MTALDSRGPIAASTVYVKGQQVARDVTCTLPEVTFATAEYKATGKLEMPNPTQLEQMDLALTKQGIDKELGALVEFGLNEMEIRWVQDRLDPDGNITHEGCKAFFKCMPKGVPGLNIEAGTISENELTFSVTRYQLFVGNVEICLIDKLKGQVRLNGKDISNDINSLL